MGAWGKKHGNESSGVEHANQSVATELADWSMGMGAWGQESGDGSVIRTLFFLIILNFFSSSIHFFFPSSLK